ncbi:MAG TPA: NAD(P)H-dependent oxidoreductase subunit E, partial [Dysgonamonadaceae bacterium]|nr:NAD(P)H-dependent oxidoreductase subunit E [Dysgonamonadaceae bacterium]
MKIKLTADKIEKIDAICRSFDNDPGELINVLHETQSEFGYLPAEVQDVIAQNLRIPVAQVYGVVSFYSFFTMTPK